MKKIIATVLAMVMALALCTTAFAVVPIWAAANGGVNSVDVYKMSNEKLATKTMTYTPAVAPVYNADGTNKTPGAIEYYTFSEEIVIGTTTYAAGTKFTMSSTYSKDASFAVKATDASVAVGTQTSPEALFFMTKVDAVKYVVTGEKFTAWGNQCGQYKNPGDTASVDYVKYTYAGNENVQALAAAATDDTPAANVLVDGAVKTMGAAVLKTPHNWTAATRDKDGNLLTVKCAICGTVGNVVASPYDPATRGHQVEQLAGGLGYVYFDYTPGTTPSTDTNKSPKTFDAGIAMYVGMALTSVAGSAVVIGKKKEF